MKKSEFESKLSETTIDESEIAHFSALAQEWWDGEGKFRILHKFNPIRIGYIRDKICEYFLRDINAEKPFENLRILDIGCGGGLLCEPMARLGAEVLGADAAEKNIKIAKIHAETSGLKINYQTITAEELAKKGEKFDIILNMEVIEHVRDVPYFVSCCSDMLKENGLMFVATLNRNLKSLVLAIIGAEYILNWLPKGTHDYKKFITPAELKKELAKNGLQIKDQKGVCYSILKDEFEISENMDVNYMVMAQKTQA